MRPDLKDLEAVAKKREKQGLPTPQWESRPRVKVDAAWLLDSFWTLSRTRAAGGFGAVNPLTLAEMRVYLDEIGVRNPSERLIFIDLMLELDSVYLECVYGQRHQGSNAAPEGR